jgi:hypothetical protein
MMSGAAASLDDYKAYDVATDACYYISSSSHVPAAVAHMSYP